MSDAVTVLYDVAWVGRGQHEGPQGQCDFLVLHPAHGVLVIEVKGGTPRRDASNWFSGGTQQESAIAHVGAVSRSGRLRNREAADGGCP